MTRIRQFALLLVCFAAPAAIAQTTIHVNAACGSDAWSGLSDVCAAPDGPKATIGAAVAAAAEPGDTVLVAGGLYTGPGNREIDFGGKHITVRSVAGPAACIIDCEGAGRAFVLSSDETRAAVIEGFTIRRGAAPSPLSSRGGGIAVLNPAFGVPAPSPTIRDCIFEECDTGIFNGGAILLQQGSAALIKRCIFRDNNSGGGGAVQGEGSQAEFIDCEFRGNTAGVGGAILLTGGADTFINCLFVENEGASPGGGAIFGNSGATTTMVNCTFADNRGPGGAFYSNRSSVATMTNCIRWGNEPDQIFVDPFSGADPIVTWSNVQGGWPGTGNIDADPMFAVPAAGDYTLSAGSPCIDAGNSEAVPAGIVTDLAGLPRFVDDPAAPDTGIAGGPGGGVVVDMGAYELQAGGCYADCDGSGELDFFDFLCFQNEFAAATPYADCDESGAHDFFDFLCFQNAFAAGCL